MQVEAIFSAYNADAIVSTTEDVLPKAKSIDLKFSEDDNKMQEVDIAGLDGLTKGAQEL
jgi:hypothetical protein